MKTTYILMLWIIAIPSSLCFAIGETDSMRCNNGITSPGDTTTELIEKCGKPIAKRASNRTYRRGRTIYYGEEWIYDFGTQEFMYIAIINGDKVKLLYSTREYGTKR